MRFEDVAGLIILALLAVAGLSVLWMVVEAVFGFGGGGAAGLGGGSDAYNCTRYTC